MRCCCAPHHSFILKFKPAAPQQPKAAISDNLGFGGHNAALVFKAYAK